MAKTIPSVEIAKEYILVELSKIFPEDNIQKELNENVHKLSEKEVWRLLEALSSAYRLNGVFRSISDDSYIWSKEEVNCGDLVLTGMNPQVDKITYSEAIQNNPLKFRDYLVKYFEKFPTSDPEGLEQFRPKGKEIKFQTIILISNDEKLQLLDGSNRLIAHLLNGNNTISAYVGRKVKVGKMKVGDSAFWLLRHVYEKGDEATKQAILTVVKELINISSDGKEAVETYWVSHVRDEKLKEVGKQILLETKKASKT
ncbi:MAG: hypothetical protein AB9915_02355 [Candidatus Dojkabacteria bacterium]